MADNSQLNVVCMDLEKSLELAFSQHSKAIGFYADSEQLVLFWSDHPRATKFPAPLSVSEILPVVKAWLESTADYGSVPDIDGDSSRSWTVSNDSWGSVSDFGWASFVRVTPTWALHGK